MNKPILSITENAAKKAKSLLQQKGMPEAAIRVKVLSGGCAGMEYKIEPDPNPPQPSDKVVEEHGLKVYLDAKGLLYMIGTTLDYKSALIGSKFIFINPNAVAECSCGESFTV